MIEIRRGLRNRAIESIDSAKEDTLEVEEKAVEKLGKRMQQGYFRKPIPKAHCRSWLEEVPGLHKKR